MRTSILFIAFILLAGVVTEKPNTDNVETTDGAVTQIPDIDNVETTDGAVTQSPDTDNVKTTDGAVTQSPDTDNVEATVGDVTQEPDTDIVATKVGKVRGLKVKAVNGKSLWSFRGIRYAMPPVGQLRFAKPVPYPKATYIIDARKQRHFCIDDLSPNEETSEDCLYLNIFLKDINQELKIKKKVLVYILGEILYSYDPGSVVTDHDIIVVTVQRRDGPFGFLAIKNAGINGNYGLWDQVLALKWVKNNIGAFGGDSDDITVSGNEQVGFLALTPMTKGLFTKVASGSLMGHSSKDAEQGDKMVREFALSLKCWHHNNSTDLDLNDKLKILQCLRSLPTLDPFKTELFNKSFVKLWGTFIPVIDGDFINKSIPSLLEDDHYLENIGFYDRKYFLTINNNQKFFWGEVFKYVKIAIQKQSGANDKDSLRLWHDYSLQWAKDIIATRLNIESVSDELASKLIYWYETNSHLDPIIELQTDWKYTIQTYAFLDTMARSKKTNGWFLYFNHYPKYLKDGVHGMTFNFDVLYLFDIDMDVVRQAREPFVTGDFEEEDYQLKTLFSALVAAFVQNGNPETPLLGRIQKGWPSYDLVGRYYLDFNNRPTVKRDWKEQIRQLWEKDLPNWAYQQTVNVHIVL